MFLLDGHFPTIGTCPSAGGVVRHWRISSAIVLISNWTADPSTWTALLTRCERVPFLCFCGLFRLNNCARSLGGFGFNGEHASKTPQYSDGVCSESNYVFRGECGGSSALRASGWACNSMKLLRGRSDYSWYFLRRYTRFYFFAKNIFGQIWWGYKAPLYLSRLN